MPLDLPTLYAVSAIAALVAGVMHLVPWATGRFSDWAAWWGCGNVMIGLGSLGILLRHWVPPAVMVMLPNLLLLCGYALVLHGVRVFRSPGVRAPPLAVVLAIVVVPMLISRDPADFADRIAYLCVVRAGCDAALTVVAVRLARTRQLHSGWLMAGMFGATVPLFLMRAWLAVHGRVGSSLTDASGSLEAWLAAAAITIIMFRGFSLLLLDAEDSQRRLTEQACRDSLTGALNRFGLARIRARLDGAVAVMTIDLDRFKQLNDEQGHAAGDAMLCLTAQVGREVLDGRGSLVRTGGDEFLCVMPGLSLVAAQAMAAELERRFASAVAAASAGAAPTLSIGVTEGSAGEGFDRLLNEADAAMYKVKRARAAARRRHAA